MHPRARVVTGSLILMALALGLGLAACGGGEPSPTSDQPAADGAPPATATVPAAAPAASVSTPRAAEAAAPDAAATDSAEPAADDPALDFTVYTPGLRARSGLTIVRSTQRAAGGTGAFFAEVRNDSGALLRSVSGSLDLLDAQNLRLGTIPLSVLLNDIPPGRSFYVGEAFAAPAGYVDAAIWLSYETAEAPSLAAFYDLPVTIESQGPGEEVAYLVRGTVENTTGRDLMFWVVTLVALDADDQIIGLAHAVVTPGTANRLWPAGAAAAFEAPFGLLAAEVAEVASVRASTAGYALLD